VTRAPHVTARASGGATSAVRTTTLLQAVTALACVLAMAAKWRSVHAFVLAIDHGDLLFADFVHHYYPTVHDSLRAGAPAGGFFYPAGFAAMLAPLGALPLGAAEIAWGLVLLASAFVIAFPLARAAANGRPALAAAGTALTVTSVPLLHDLKWGQVSLPIVACAGLAFVLHERGRVWAPAALVAIAAGIKGYPLVFVGWFAARLDVRSVGRAAAACVVALVLLPAIVLGPAHALFVQRVSTRAVLGAADGVLRDFNSQYAPAVLARYHGGWGAAGADVKAAGTLASLAAVFVIGALAVLVARSRAPRIAERRALLGFVLIASSVPFWLRTSWSHYFVHLPIAQVLLAGMLSESPRARDRLALLVLVAPSVFLSNVLGLFDTEGWWYYANAGSLFFADALVLLACAGVVVEEHVRDVVARRNDRRRDDGQRTLGVAAPVARWSAIRAMR
jgi:hypothetical protein